MIPRWIQDWRQAICKHAAGTERERDPLGRYWLVCPTCGYREQVTRCGFTSNVVPLHPPTAPQAKEQA